MIESFEDLTLEPDVAKSGASLAGGLGPITLEARGLDLPPPARGAQWFRISAFAGAVALHAAALALCLGFQADQHGEDGARLEAIAVSIVLVAPNAAGTPDLRQSPPEPEPPSETSAPAAEMLREDKTEKPIEPKPEQPKTEVREPEEEKMAAPIEPEPKPDPPPETEPETPPPDPPVEKKPVVEPVPPRPPPPPAAAPAPPPTPKSASTAVASAGVMRAYAKRVALALARSKPKGLGRRGTVRLRFVVGLEGTAETVEMVQSSGQPRLDRVALTTVGRITFPTPPPNASAEQRTFVVPYEFR